MSCSALSFSSFNDEPIPVGYRMKAYPDRIEILSPSPRTTITAESLDVRAGDAAAGWDEVRISIEPGAVN